MSRVRGVLAISHNYPRSAQEWGGIFVQEQVRDLRALGLDVRVCVGNPVWILKRQPLKALKVLFGSIAAALGLPMLRRRVPWRDLQGIPVLFFDYLSPPMADWGEKAARRYYQGLRRWLPLIRRELRVEVLHAYTSFLDGTAATELGRDAGLPIVIMEHTGPFTALTSTPEMRAQTQAAVNRASAVLTVSDYMGREMRRHLDIAAPHKLKTMSYGVDPAVFRPPAAPRAADGTIRALWVGGYQPVKQPGLLVRAFARARAADARLRLTLVGSGALEHDVRTEARALGLGDAVEFLASRSRPEIAALMQRHDFLVLSSETDTFAIVVIEALACGRPVLSTRCGGPEGTIRDPRYGELVDNSEAALAEGFLRMARRLPEFEPEALADYARREYSNTVVAERIRATYDGLSRSAA